MKKRFAFQQILRGLVCIALSTALYGVAYAAGGTLTDADGLVSVTVSNGAAGVTPNGDGAFTVTAQATGTNRLGFIPSTSTTTVTFTNTSNTYDAVLTGTIATKLTAGSGEGKLEVKLGSTTLYTAPTSGGVATYDESITIPKNNGKLTIKVESPSGKGNTIEMSYSASVTPKVTYAVTFKNDSTYGTYSINGTDYANLTDKTQELDNESGVAIVVTPQPGYVCIGLKDGNGKLVDGVNADNETTFVPAEACTIEPVYVSRSSVPTAAPFLVRNARFYTWESAFVEAGNGGSVILVEDYSLPSNVETCYPSITWKYVDTSDGVKYMVPSTGIFVIPYDANHSISTADYDYVADAQYNNCPSAYKTLTVPSGVTMEVNGTLIVNGRAKGSSWTQTGVIVGTYGKMVVQGEIEVNGTLYARGYIVNTNDMTTADSLEERGCVTVNPTGKVYMPLQVLDYRGGNKSNSEKDRLFPISNYYFSNIMIPATYVYGAELYGQYLITTERKTGTLSVSEKILNGDTLIFSTSDSAFFYCKSGNVRTDYSYSGDRMSITMDGEIELKDLVIKIVAPLVGNVEITTRGKQVPINSNITINVNGTLNCSSQVKFLPGAKVNVASGGTVNANANTFLYRAANYDANWNNSDGTSTIGRTRLSVAGLIQSAGSKMSDGDAQISVAGTLNVGESATVWQSGTSYEGTTAGVVGKAGGKIVFKGGSISETVPNMYEMVNANSAELNGNWQPLTGLLAGVSASAADYRPFTTSGTGSYSATDVWASGANAAWYQYTISVADGKKGITASSAAPTVGKTYTGSDTTVGYAVKGGTFAFSVDKGMVFSDETNDYLADDPNTITVNADTVLHRCVAGVMNGESVDYFLTLQEAITAYAQPADGKYIQMVDDSSAAITFATETVLDLNGHTVRGVTVNGTIKGGDSSSNGFKTPSGSLTVTSGAVETVAQVNGKDYVAVQTAGTSEYSFHRFAITPIACRFYLNDRNDGTSHAHLEVKAAVQGDDTVIGKVTDLGFTIINDNNTTEDTADDTSATAWIGSENIPEGFKNTYDGEAQKEMGLKTEIRTVSFVAVTYDTTKAEKDDGTAKAYYEAVHAITAMAAFDTSSTTPPVHNEKIQSIGTYKISLYEILEQYAKDGTAAGAGQVQSFLGSLKSTPQGG